MSKPRTIGQRVKERLNFLGMTQCQLSKNTGLTEATISMIVSGQRSPHAETIILLCLHLGCSADYLLGIEALR